MKNSKKAFTLVELLVVIAILAVLASVSIIGYTAFTKKAVENNAISELTQVKTLITSGTTADSNNEFVVFFGKEAPAAGNKAYKFSFDGGTNQYSYTELDLTSENLSTIELKISDEAKLAGTFDFTVANKISYSLTSGTNTANVTWDLAAGTVK